MLFGHGRRRRCPREIPHGANNGEPCAESAGNAFEHQKWYARYLKWVWFLITLFLHLHEKKNHLKWYLALVVLNKS